MVLIYVRFPLSLRNVEDLLAERGIDLCHETVRFWWNRFGRCSRLIGRHANNAWKTAICRSDDESAPCAGSEG